MTTFDPWFHFLYSYVLKSNFQTLFLAYQNKEIQQIKVSSKTIQKLPDKRAKNQYTQNDNQGKEANNPKGWRDNHTVETTHHKNNIISEYILINPVSIPCKNSTPIFLHSQNLYPLVLEDSTRFYHTFCNMGWNYN